MNKVLYSLALACLLSPYTNAASISASGLLEDHGGDHSDLGHGIYFAATTSAVVPPPEGQWSNDAWDRELSNNLPAWVSGVTPGAALGSSGGWGYEEVITNNGSAVQSGAGVTSGDGGTEREVISLTLGDGVPSNFTVRLYTDNNDNAGNFTPSNVRVDIGGMSSNQDVVSFNQIGDLYNFDVSGAVSGDVLSIYSTDAGASNLDVIGGVLLVPEPSAVALVVFGIATCFITLRRWTPSSS